MGNTPESISNSTSTDDSVESELEDVDTVDVVSLGKQMTMYKLARKLGLVTIPLIVTVGLVGTPYVVWLCSTKTTDEYPAISTWVCWL